MFESFVLLVCLFNFFLTSVRDSVPPAESWIDFIPIYVVALSLVSLLVRVVFRTVSRRTTTTQENCTENDSSLVGLDAPTLATFKAVRVCSVIALVAISAVSVGQEIGLRKDQSFWLRTSTCARIASCMTYVSFCASSPVIAQSRTSSNRCMLSYCPSFR